jgi:hypothetical protein
MALNDECLLVEVKGSSALVKRNRAKILRTKILYFLLFTLPMQGIVWCNTSSLEAMGISKRAFAALQKDEILLKSIVQTHEGEQKTQSLDYQITGLHPKPCSIALRRLTLYEQYSDYLNFVTQSQYDPESQRIWLLLGHTLLPFNMSLEFQIPRMTGPGVYPIEFNKGFLTGLKGAIEISQHKNRCLFVAHAKWSGPHSGINDSIFSLFSRTLSRMAMNSLFRISMTP